MPKLIDLTGQRFGRLVVTHCHPERDRNGLCLWHCVCDCGKTKLVRGQPLLRGVTVSCGCYRRETSTTHGLSTSAEYRIWRTIKDRCYNPKSAGYVDYGARGITMSDEWRGSFLAFYHDMGPRPSNRHSVERGDNDLGYSKHNCRWATWEEQANNRRNTRRYTLDGKTQSLAQWSKELNIKYGTLTMRLKRGLSFEDAVADVILNWED